MIQSQVVAVPQPLYLEGVTFHKVALQSGDLKESASPTEVNFIYIDPFLIIRTFLVISL
jgi:hypothetical protein